ncbi:MAG: isoaspartyl peptidase/L-asparaginase [Myxococcales bacterium]
MPVTGTWSAEGAEYAVLVHGGAGSRPPEELTQACAGCERAAGAAAAILAAGGTALDAVQRAVEVMEDDPRFNAGTGGALCSDGSLELDASIVDGRDLRAGAVCALPPHRNPVAIARAVLEAGRHVLYAGAGAAAFARQHGFEATSPQQMITESAREELQRALRQDRARLWSGGTVGAVARDLKGHVAAATSTGGVAGKAPGRVGDSPIVGAGTAADDGLGACSATGEGDGILRVSMASDVLARLRRGDPPERAAGGAVARLQDRVGAVAGLIVVGPDGRLGLARTTRSMAWAALQPSGRHRGA